MNEIFTSLSQSLSTTFFVMLENVIVYLPQIVTALFVLLIGIGIASLVYYAVLHVLKLIKLDSLIRKTPIESVLNMIGAKKSMAEILGLLGFWFIIFATCVFMADILGLEQLSQVFGLIILYIPQCVVGLILLVVGLLLARFIETLIVGTVDKKHRHFGVLLGKTAYILTIVFVVPVVLNQLGVNIEFITTNMSIVLAIVLAGLAVSFVLNTRTIVSNWIACQQLRSVLSLGNTVQLEKHHGTVRGFTNTGVIVHHQGVNTVIPALEFFEQSYTVKAEEK